MEYLYLLKNIRGVLLADRKLDSNVINWLKRSIRWKPIGAGPKNIQLIRGHGIKSKVLKQLVFPFTIHEDIRTLLESNGVSPLLAEAMLLSSIYISPLVVLSENTLASIHKYASIGSVLTDKKLSSNDIKIHMRIAEYAMKDYYFDIIKSLWHDLQKKDLNELMKQRKKFARDDIKRFWRINRNRGRTVISYIDPLIILKENISDLKNIIQNDVRSLLGLGIIVVVHIENILKSRG